MEPTNLKPEVKGVQKAAVPATDWVSGRYDLKFLFGEYNLFSAPLRSLRLSTHFLSIDASPEQLISNHKDLASDIDVVFLDSVPVKKTYPKLFITRPMLRYVPARYRRYYIDTSGSFEDYLNRFTSKSRSTLRRKVNKFKKSSGDPTVCREYRTQKEVAEEFYPQALELSRRTYQHNLLGAGIPDSEDFIAQMKTLAEQDQIRSYLLFHSGKAVSYLYCPIIAGVGFYSYVGYDPEFAAWSCGTVLLYLALERLFAEKKLRFFDFTQGEGAHKEFFATEMVYCADFLYFRPTIRNLCLVTAHISLATLSKCTVTLLDRLGLKGRIKHLLRGV